MSAVKDAVNNLLGRKPTGPKVRYGVVAAGWISQAAFMPGVGQTSNSGRQFFSLDQFIKETISRSF